MPVTVVGHQWWWEFDYPEYGFITANELHVPLTRDGKPTPIYLTLESNDVIHSFWVPKLAGKMDLMPGQENFIWFVANQTYRFKLIILRSCQI